MKFLVILLFMLINLLAAESISPTQFKVVLVKHCEVLGLRKTPDRKSSKVYTTAHYGSCVQNLGCMREITQKQLENEHNQTKRDFMAWKYPVWCKVESDGKRGWVRKQFLKDAPCGEDE